MRSILKLKAQDGNIIEVIPKVIKEMITIQTMLNCPLVINNNDEDNEPIPIFTINSDILNKLIEWTNYYIENSDNSKYTIWSEQFFLQNLKYIIKLEEGAKFLDIQKYLETNQVFMDKYFEVMTESTDFLKNISCDSFGDLIARDSLNVPNEQTVFESLISWISEDIYERSNNLEYLISKIRIKFLNKKYIETNVKPFLEKNNNSNLIEHLSNITKPRTPYQLTIVSIHEKDTTQCFKYKNAMVCIICILLNKLNLISILF